jgi:hypothetical protein
MVSHFCVFVLFVLLTDSHYEPRLALNARLDLNSQLSYLYFPSTGTIGCATKHGSSHISNEHKIPTMMLFLTKYQPPLPRISLCPFHYFINVCLETIS